MARRAPLHARAPRPDEEAGVEGNARLTSSIAVVLLVLLFLEGVTILQIGALVRPHVFIGLLVIPPVLYKVATTTWRFVKYYVGDPAYRKKGPPLTLLRLLGPVVVVLTLLVIGSGVGLVVIAPTSWHSRLLLVHKASFVLWFGAMAVHVVGHLVETARFAPRDWLHHTRREVRGASLRQWIVASSLAAGLLVATWITPYAANWRIISN